jgi:hypothetical protein
VVVDDVEVEEAFVDVMVVLLVGTVITEVEVLVFDEVLVEVEVGFELDDEVVVLVDDVVVFAEEVLEDVVDVFDVLVLVVLVVDVDVEVVADDK